MKTMLLQVQRNTDTQFFSVIQVICIMCLTVEIHSLAGTAELLGPLQITQTRRSREKRRFGDSTEQQNRQTLDHSEINELEAA